MGDKEWSQVLKQWERNLKRVADNAKKSKAIRKALADELGLIIVMEHTVGTYFRQHPKHKKDARVTRRAGHRYATVH